MIKAVIFDWFGVCTEKWLDTLLSEIREKVDRETFKECFLKHVYPYMRAEVSGMEFLANVLGELGISTKGYEYLLTLTGKVDDDVMDTILGIKGNGYKTALVTDTFVDVFPVIERQVGGMSKYFDVVVTSIEHKCAKSERNGKLFRIALEELHEKPGSCVLIDDREINIGIAEKMGMSTITFSNAEQLKRELSKMGVRYD